jgi:hypothetical protein
MYICKRVLHSGLKALVYAWMVAYLWKILIFRICSVFPQMSKVFSRYFWRCPSFPENYQSPSNTSQQDFICRDFSLHSCVALNVMTSCAYLWNSPSALYATHYDTYCFPACQACHFDSIWQHCILLKFVIHINYLAHFKDLCCMFSVSYFLQN